MVNLYNRNKVPSLILINLDFWPQATLKGPKRSFVVLVVVGVESSSKNVRGEQKRFVGTKKIRISQN